MPRYGRGGKTTLIASDYPAFFVKNAPLLGFAIYCEIALAAQNAVHAGMDALKPATRSQNSGARSQESEQVSKPLEWEIRGIKHRKKLNANPQMLRHPGAPPRNFKSGPTSHR